MLIPLAIQLRWPRSYINTVQPSGQHHLFCNCRAVYISRLYSTTVNYATKRQGKKPCPCTEEMQSNDFKEVQEPVICIKCYPSSRAWAMSSHTASSLPDSSIPALTHPGPRERRRHWRCQCHEQDQRYQHDEPQGQEDQSPQFRDGRRGAEHGERSMTCSCVASSITDGVPW